MNLAWYVSRLRKMGPMEVIKRAIENARIYGSRIKYRHAEYWPYERFAGKHAIVKSQALDDFETPPSWDWSQYAIYNMVFDLTKPIEWYFSSSPGTRWPASHYATINYRPGNRCGDVRINWELNRLQFLPGMTCDNEELAKRILADWMEKNPFLHGPAYIASMEVALRWIAIYRSYCLFKTSPEESLLRKLTGLAVGSGRFIESRLSTHSSAGNHLIVESVGLFWIGKALGGSHIGRRWMEKARYLLNREILKQIHPDGSSREQSFWYLGFVLDAVFHYFILEKRDSISAGVWDRIHKAITFIADMMLPDGSFPDFGDRDDGYVCRPRGDYTQSPFPRLIELGNLFYGHRGRDRGSGQREQCQGQDGKAGMVGVGNGPDSIVHSTGKCRLRIKTYPHGGMTLLNRGRGRLLFRHAPLGLESLYGHGHADGLSVLLWWNDRPVLMDLGSGQYNGDQHIRNYFRKTLAHNTVEIGGTDQATITGPFMWADSYHTTLHDVKTDPHPHLSASHDGYVCTYSTTHTREIEWPTDHQIYITDRFTGPGGHPFRGVLNFGPCKTMKMDHRTLIADFDSFDCLIELPAPLVIDIFHGAKEPFLGWHSSVYGEWKPNFSVVFSGDLGKNHHYTIQLKIDPK